MHSITHHSIASVVGAALTVVWLTAGCGRAPAVGDRYVVQDALDGIRITDGQTRADEKVSLPVNTLLQVTAFRDPDTVLVTVLLSDEDRASILSDLREEEEALRESEKDYRDTLRNPHPAAASLSSAQSRIIEIRKMKIAHFKALLDGSVQATISHQEFDSRCKRK